MNALSLFSGIGGLDLAAEWAGFKTVAFCEQDKFCQQVLKKHWPNVRIYDDVRTLPTDELPPIELVHGGYPCQPFSGAGNRKGTADKRHLWPEMFRIIRKIKPTWVVAENVKGHITLGLDSVCDDLESEGYSVRSYCLPACAIGAVHRRERLFILANTVSNGRHEGKASTGDVQAAFLRRAQEPDEDSEHEGCCRIRAKLDWECRTLGTWGTEPPEIRVDDGIPRELDLYRELIYEKGDNPNADAEVVRKLRWRILRAHK